MIDPVKLAKDNGLWPDLPPCKSESEREWWRDTTRAKIQKLIQDYTAWAQSDKGVIADPGPAPDDITLPLPQPNPSDTVEKHHEFRRATDAWYDTEYLPRLLPETELWAAANSLWKTKQSKAKAATISNSRRVMGWIRFLAYLVTAGVTGLLALTFIAILDVPLWIIGVLCGILAMFAVFGTDVVFNRIEDRMARAQADEESRLDREVAAKQLADRQRVLQRLGIPDDTGGSGSNGA